MKYYETLYIINPNLPEEDYRETLLKFNNLIEKNKGVLIRVEEWGKKSLAYPVKKFDKGYYVLVRYCGEPETASELERDLRLDDRSIRFQTIKLSDQADPEELKSRAEEGPEKAAEEEETSSESEESEESQEA